MLYATLIWAIEVSSILRWTIAVINYGVDAGVSVKGLLIRLAGGGCLVSVQRVFVVVTIVGLVPVPGTLEV